MSKTITIKLTKANSRTGPFTIKDQNGNTIAENIEKSILINGISYIVDDDVTMVTLISNGKCVQTKTKNLVDIPVREYANTVFTESATACLWKHLQFNLYNSYYGVTEPYILEYPFNYSYQDQILQSVQLYDKVFKYFDDGTGVFNTSNKIELDDEWFSHSVVYNNQQSSGTLKLVAKPINNLREYMRYPLYNVDSKSILYTKSDNFYQFNDFFNAVKDRTVPLFIVSCESLSIDKTVNNDNMVYTQQSFRKDNIRAKDLKIRMILDKSDIHIVSQFIIAPSQLSYK